MSAQGELFGLEETSATPVGNDENILLFPGRTDTDFEEFDATVPATKLADYLATAEGQADVTTYRGELAPIIEKLTGLSGERARKVELTYLSARWAKTRAEPSHEGENHAGSFLEPRRLVKYGDAYREICMNPERYGWHEGAQPVSCGGATLPLGLAILIRSELDRHENGDSE
jgi:hypothetical protein